MLRTTGFLILLYLFCWTWTADLAIGHDRALQRHPWARFGPGSLKTVAIVTKTLGPTGEVVSTTRGETKTTLVQVDPTRFMIKVETTMQVAGKQLAAPPKYITRGFNGEVNDQEAVVKRLGIGEIAICGKRFKSEIQRVVIKGDDIRLVTTVHYSPDHGPYVLRRETKGVSGEVNRFESLVEVVALDAPVEVLGSPKHSSHVKTVRKTGNGDTAVTLEVHCMDVPGAVVSHTKRIFAADGRVVQRQTLELLDFRVSSKQATSPQQSQRPKRRRIFSRSRDRRG